MRFSALGWQRWVKLSPQDAPHQFRTNFAPSRSASSERSGACMCPLCKASICWHLVSSPAGVEDHCGSSENLSTHQQCEASPPSSSQELCAGGHSADAVRESCTLNT